MRFISRYYSTLVGWTDIGRKIQCLSNPCPVPVQGLSKNGSCQGSVEAMSMYCLSPVRPLSSQGILGQRSDRQIQRLSKACPLKLKNWTFSLWTNIGQILDLGNSKSGFTFWGFEKRNWNVGQTLDVDRLWTKSGFRLCIARGQPPAIYPSTDHRTNIGQTLDKDILWTKFEMFINRALIPNTYQLDKLLTNIEHGQTDWA